MDKNLNSLIEQNKNHVQENEEEAYIENTRFYSFDQSLINDRWLEKEGYGNINHSATNQNMIAKQQLGKKNTSQNNINAKEKKSNSKNVFMRKINGLLSDEKLLETINNESKWQKEKIKDNADIIKNESNNSLAEMVKTSFEPNNKLKTLQEDYNNEQQEDENQDSDDKCLGKRVKRLTNSESARNSRRRKRLYIELLEEKLKVEERRNKSYQEEIKLLKHETNNMMINAIHSKNYNYLLDKNDRQTLFKRILLHKDCEENLQRIFDEFTIEFREQENGCRTNLINDVGIFFKTMKDAGIGSIINFCNADVLNSLKDEFASNSLREYIPIQEVMSKLNTELLKSSTEYHNIVMSKQNEYTGIRNEIKEKINNIINGIPSSAIQNVFSAAVEKIIENQREAKCDENMLTTLADTAEEPQIKKIYIPNEDILDIL